MPCRGAGLVKRAACPAVAIMLPATALLVVIGVAVASSEAALGRAMHDFMGQLAHEGCAPQAIATRAKQCLPDHGMLKEAFMGSMGVAC